MLRKERTPRCLLTAALAAASLLVMAGPGWAATESGDAGDLPASAQEVNDTSITGTVADIQDEDMYKVCLSGGGSFSATTAAGNWFDSQLFLFDSNGLGVYGNDDDTQLSGPSTLPSGHALTPAAAGTYYLAISSFNNDPVSAWGPIFPGDFFGVHGPTGSGGGSPVSGWTVYSGTPGSSYTITLTGVVACAPGDSTDPTVTIATPADGATYQLGESVTADFACADENGGSGLADCVGTVADGDLIDTSTVGSKQSTVTAHDNAGNETTVMHDYSVVYPFAGFFAPIDKDALNVLKAGQGAPLRFSLGGDHGLAILAAGSPSSRPVQCDSSLPSDPVEQTVTAGASGLSYDAATDVYAYTWKTDKAWAGTCRELTVTLIDATSHSALFMFRR